MKRVYFTIADKNNMAYYEMLKASLAKVTDDKLILIDEKKIKQLGDPHFYYRATPIIAAALMKKYDMVCKLDADQIILGNMDHIWEGDFDAAVVKNSNPKEDETYPVRLLDIHPLSYVNCGMVVLKSKKFVKHWLDLCMSPHFNNFQYREQDLLNIMVFYMSNQFGGVYKVNHLDDGNKWHGLVWKQYEPFVTYKDGKFILPKKNGYPEEDKELIAWHVASGNEPNKMNYRTKFQPEVVKEIDKLLA